MKQIKTLLAFLAVLTLTTAAKAQSSYVWAQDTLTVAQMQEDFNYMIEQYERIHPNPTWSLGEEQYNELKQQTLAQLDRQMPLLDFWRIIARWNQHFDGHTQLAWPAKQSSGASGNVTPFPPKSVVQYRDRKLFFGDYVGMPDSLRGCEIVAVNGHPSAKVIEAILPYVSHESEAFINTTMLQSLNYYYDVLFGSEALVTLRYRTASGEKTVSLDRSAITELFQRIVDRRSPRNLPWRFYIFPEQGIALLEFNKCRPDERLEQFDSEVGTFIDSVNRLGIRHLFVDLSQNQGGNDMFCYRFLRHIATIPDTVVLFDYASTEHGTAEPVEDRYIMTFRPKEPQYSGRLYFIQSQFTYSAAVILANLAKQYGFGTLIGEETGGLTTTYIRLNQCKLPNSGLAFYCSDKQNRYLGTTGPRGVMPDIPLEIGYKHLFRSFTAEELQQMIEMSNSKR